MTTADATSLATSARSVEEVERLLDAVLDDPKAALRLKLQRATRRLIAEKGLDVSMDDIAEASGVNRRTLFRHVESRNALVADALTSAMDWFQAEIEQAVLRDRPLEAWITEFALETMQIHIAAGRGLWQLATTPDSELPPELAAVNARRRVSRQQVIPVIADAIWQRAGGSGECSQVVTDGVSISISAFTTRSMIDDLDRDLNELAQSIGTILATLVDTQVAKQPGQAASR